MKKFLFSLLTLMTIVVTTVACTEGIEVKGAGATSAETTQAQSK